MVLLLACLLAVAAGSPSHPPLPKSPAPPADIPEDLREFLSQPIAKDGLDRFLLRDAYPFWRSEPPAAKSGEPLLLSPLLENGEIEEARRLSRVKLPNYPEDIESYSGFLTVDKKHNGNLFYWFFPSAKEDPNNETPLLLWLQGGPGASSLIGLFLEFGPFSVKNSSSGYQLVKNEYSWAKEFSLLFIDQPVGTGFSYTDSSEGYAKNLTTSSGHLYEALTQFFALYGDYEEKPFYITGESYAGKYVPYLAAEIHKRNSLGGATINLQGVAIGNGFTDPPSMLSYSHYLYQLGLIDTKSHKILSNIEEYTRKLIESGQFLLAFNGFSAIMKIFYTVSGYKTPYNYLKEIEDDADPFQSDFAKYVQTPEVRQALHVGDTEYKSIGPVYWNLIGDFMKSGKPQLEEVMKHYKVLLYSGQMDIICAYPLSVNLFKKLEFEEKEKYEKAQRWIWYHGDRVAGYIKSSGRFTEALIRNSGHLCPADQPAWALDLITRFTKDQLKPEADANLIETGKRKKPANKVPEIEKVEESEKGPEEKEGLEQKKKGQTDNGTEKETGVQKGLGKGQEKGVESDEIMEKEKGTEMNKGMEKEKGTEMNKGMEKEKGTEEGKETEKEKGEKKGGTQMEKESQIGVEKEKVIKEGGGAKEKQPEKARIYVTRN